MRHGVKINNLTRTYAHRKALLRNMTLSLVEHKRIQTTLAKAKELRKFVEPLLNKGKLDTTHSRRMVFATLQDKESVKTIFTEIGPKIKERPGGYTRILKLGPRRGDGAEMALIELVDYNPFFDTHNAKAKDKKTRRGRKKLGSDPAPKAEQPKPARVVAETPKPVENETIAEPNETKAENSAENTQE